MTEKFRLASELNTFLSEYCVDLFSGEILIDPNPLLSAFKSCNPPTSEGVLSKKVPDVKYLARLCNRKTGKIVGTIEEYGIQRKERYVMDSLNAMAFKRVQDISYTSIFMKVMNMPRTVIIEEFFKKPKIGFDYFLVPDDWEIDTDLCGYGIYS